MSEYSDKALLPAGMCDVLPPDAEIEAKATESLVEAFSRHGYERVKPPLIEFEESLLAGSSSAMAEHTFRLMDPISQRMMGVRPDMTLQVARIATTRLKNEPRPLRLCYGGQILRVRGTQLRPERQFGQVGAELIGSAEPAADAEVVRLAVESMQFLGIDNISVDLALPTLVPAITQAHGVADEVSALLREALNRKDAAAVEALSGKLGKDLANMFTTLLAAAGPAEATLGILEKLDLPEAAAAERAQLVSVVEIIRRGAPSLTLTIDPVESRGFEYHTGVTFSFFAEGVRGELGSGGRYLAGANNGEKGEPATGMTLFMDTVLRAIPASAPAKRLFLPFGTAIEKGRSLRDQGWITVEGLDSGEDAGEGARHLGCSHLLTNGEIREI